MRPEKSDGELLRLYRSQNSQDAFAELARRYAGLVYATCRRELGDPVLAEDAAQGVFLLLSQKASGLTQRDTLADWLHSASRHVARNLGRQERRRQMNEIRAAREAALSPSAATDAADVDPLWERIEPHLDDALGRLKPADRNAVLLRFVQERSLAEVGATLGLSENTARMRVTRALEKIRAHLSKAGIVVSVALLAALLEQDAARAAVPATLLARLADPAGLGGAVGSGVAVGLGAGRFAASSAAVKIVVVAAVLVVSSAGWTLYRSSAPQRLGPAEQRRAFDALTGTWTGTLEFADDATRQRFTYPTRVEIRSLGDGNGLEFVAAYTGTSRVDITTIAGDAQNPGRFSVTNGGPQSSHALSGVGDLVRQTNGFAFLGESPTRDSDVRLRFIRTGTTLTIAEDFRPRRASAYEFRNRFTLAR